MSNSRLHTKLKRYINQRDNLKTKLPNIYYCGSRVFKQVGALPAVFLLANEKDEVRTFGTVSCHSAWACPKCTAQVMAQKGTDIACMIDAMAKWYNKYAFMVTFTIPHKKFQSCEEVFELLQGIWRNFSKQGEVTSRKKLYTLKNDLGERSKKGGALGVGQKGTQKQYTITSRKPYSQFRSQLDIKYSVKVFEFTYGENGWHPHIHALFWTDKANFKNADTILKFEDQLLNQWWECGKLVATRFKGEEFAENMFSEESKHPKTGHKSVYFSRDNHGKVRIEKSSHYITGWTADKELTGGTTFKTGHIANGQHLTPNQILERIETDPEHWEDWIKLYIEYALATRGHRRVEFSKGAKPTCKEIITKWKKTNDYMEVLKKKVTDKAHTWRVAYWFSEKQWFDICWLDLTTDKPILTEILTRAPNKELLEEYLTEIGIPLTTHEHTHAEHIAKRVFENRISDALIA